MALEFQIDSSDSQLPSYQKGNSFQFTPSLKGVWAWIGSPLGRIPGRIDGDRVVYDHGGLISRSFRVIGAVFISLAIIPVLMLGLLGHFRVPVDIISAPGANIAIGIGVDAMIHLLVWVRRHPSGTRSREAWSAVCSRLWKPTLYSMPAVCTALEYSFFPVFLPPGDSGFRLFWAPC